MIYTYITIKYNHTKIYEYDFIQYMIDSKMTEGLCFVVFGQILKEMGWDHCVDHVENLLLVKCPKTYTPF